MTKYQHIATIKRIINYRDEIFYRIDFAFPPSGFPHKTAFTSLSEALAYARSNGWSIDIAE